MVGRKDAAGRYARYPAGAILVLALCVRPEARTYHPPVPLVASGLIGPSGPVLAGFPEEARGASYLPASSVLRLPDGRLRYPPPGAAEAVTVPPDDPAAEAAAASRAWLAAGTVPGGDAVERAISERAPRPAPAHASETAALAGLHPRWRSVWPRDASFVAVAFAAQGHHEESYQVLSFLAAAQEPDGTWEARYDAAGTPVLDGRTLQLDARAGSPGLPGTGSLPRGAAKGARRGAVASRAPRPTRRRPRSGPTVCRPAARTTGGRDLEAEPRDGRSLRTGLRAAADLARSRPRV